MDLAKASYKLEQLQKETPNHLMSYAQNLQFSTLSAQISALKAELYCLMVIDNDV